jgi:hypothetical protein
MGILAWVLFGFVVGLVARAITPGRDSIGIVGTTVLGILGALVAGWLGQALGWYTSEGMGGFISATVGAVAVLAAYHFFNGRRRPLGKITHRSDEDHRDVA